MPASKGSKKTRKPGSSPARAAKAKHAARSKPRPARTIAATRNADQPMERIIFAYISRIAAERNLDHLLLLLADMGRDIVGADRCTVWLLNQKTGELWSKVAHGMDRITIPKGHGIAGHVATSGEPLIINDPYSDDRFDKDVDRRTGYRTRSILSLPVADSEGRTVGVYQAVNKKSGAFTATDREHLLLASSYTGEVLKTAQMQEEIEATQREIIFMIAEGVEMHSRETGNHIKRIAEYCRLLGAKYGLSEAETEILRLSSPMHDIGKIAIRDSILLKPGLLTDAEREVMMTHAALGHYMLGHSERRLLHSAAIIAYQHHERWDGKGYPCGLEGEAIHIYGRITAIADVFDALASDRVYKKAWEMPRIKELFEAEKGHQFDPDLTKVFLGSFEDFVKIRETYRDEPPQPGEPAGCPEN